MDEPVVDGHSIIYTDNVVNIINATDQTPTISSPEFSRSPTMLRSNISGSLQEQTFTESKKLESQRIINSLYDLYANDPYMLAKTHTYICNQLPNILENIKRVHIERVNHAEEMLSEQDAFIQSFLNYNQYFYISSTDKFFYYDGIHYHIYNEDDILHHVLSSISKDTQLMSWKQRTKINIMKRIRENSILKTIPESETIQCVIDALYPTLFANRAEAKYFLTLLGDNILRKQPNQIHFLHPYAKHFIREFNNICQIVIGVGLSQSIKHKYYDHSYQDCRLVKINECVKNESTWGPIINQYAIDIICVACHYSIRYGSADEFVLNASNDNELIANVFYMKHIKPIDLVNIFMNEYLDIDETTTRAPIINQHSIGQSTQLRTTQITWKNMQYLWKHFIDSKNLPSIIFMQTLKGLLIDKLSVYYNETHDSFLGICSKFLPAIQKFLLFWGDTMTFDETETDLEIEEIIRLFRKWCESTCETVSNLNDKQILDLIAYFFPNLEIERDKYISKVRCSLWDKQLDIQVAMDNLKETVRTKYVERAGFPQEEVVGERLNSVENFANATIYGTGGSSPTTGINNGSCSPQETVALSRVSNSFIRIGSPVSNRNVSIYDAYLFYCKYHSNNQIASKSYFEKYVFDNYFEYIVESKFLSSDWYMI